MEYAVRKGSPESPTIAQVGQSSSRKRMWSWSNQGAESSRCMLRT